MTLGQLKKGVLQGNGFVRARPVHQDSAVEPGDVTHTKQAGQGGIRRGRKQETVGPVSQRTRFPPNAPQKSGN